MTTDKLTAEHYLLQEHKIPVFNNFMSFGELLVASAATQGALESIPESKGKKITGIAGGHRKLFIFEEENCRYFEIQKQKT